jgi:transcriptional regulator with XRE-family HTH domain
MAECNIKKTFATRFRELREEKGLSQGDIAKEFGVSRGSISYYENSERTADIEFAYKSAVFFGTSVDYLLGKSDLRTADTEATGAANYTGLSDKSAAILCRIKLSEESKKVFDVLNLLIEQNPPPPLPEDFVLYGLQNGEIDQKAFSDARHMWRTNHVHLLNKLSQYLYHVPPVKNNNVENEPDFGFGIDGVINDYDFVSQVHLNVVQDAVKCLKTLIQ